MSRPDTIAASLTVAFTKAVELARRRKVTLPDTYYGELQDAARATAFTVSHLSTLDQIGQVLDELRAALDSGDTFAQWRTRVQAGGIDLAPRHLETVFRNAVQTAYNSGRRLEHVEHESARPYLMYDAINDSRTREAHRAMDGFIAPVGHPVWKRWTPPNGHNCRCGVVSLSERQAKARGYTGRVKLPAGAEPDEGWSYDPTDTVEHTGVLSRLVERAAAALPAVIRKASDKRIKPVPVRVARKPPKR